MSSSTARVPSCKAIQNRELSDREVEVKALLLCGCQNGHIASELGISEETVKRHVAKIFDKTGFSSRSEVIAYFFTQEINALKAEVLRLTAESRPAVCSKCANTDTLLKSLHLVQSKAA